MTATSKASTGPALQFELKAGFYTLPTLRVLGSDPDALDVLLSERSRRAPEFFRNLPLVIDLTAVKDSDLGADFAMMIGLVRGYGLVPVGIRGGSPLQQEQAKLMELAVLPPTRAGINPASESQGNLKQSPGVATPSKIVDAPVRSGQRVYAQGGDLVVLGAVSSGAEILADGHIHAYGRVLGRIMAGVQGDTSARIFCADLSAELVSVAGQYKLSEDIATRFRGRPVQVLLDGGTLVLRRIRD